MEIISSKDNKLLKHSKKLKIKKHRQENREFMIEGVRFIEEAVLADINIKYCLYSDNLNGDRVESLLKKLNDKHTKLYKVENNLIDEMSDTQNPQGIVAVVEKKEYSKDFLIDESDFVVIIDRIQDPGNLGTIIRTSDAAGVDAICIADGTVDPYSSKVLRSTMGSIFHIPIINSSDIIKTIIELKYNGYTVFVSSLQGSTKYYEQDYRNKTAIVIGNEGNGVDSEIIHIADRLIKIPMPGKAESLNAGIAGGILLFEVVKQRMDVDK